MSATRADDWNSTIIEEFRENGGVVGGGFTGMPLLLLHHFGRHTGKERVNPLAYQRVGDGYAIFASKGGAPVDPDWYQNLVAHPDVSVEVDTERVAVRAKTLTGAEREAVWERQKKNSPGFAEYETKAGRTIPVVLLEPRR